jgi:thiamine biosynthesis lipoprotein
VYVLLLALAAALACADPCPRDRLELAGETMGTRWSATVACPSPSLRPAPLEAELAGVLARIDARMSTWREDSELSRFNRHAGTDWFAVSAETAAVAAQSLRMAELTGGAFDATVYPLVRLWGFGPRRDPAAAPGLREIARARRRVGPGKLAVRAAPPALRKLRPDVELDFSGIAKGHAADAVGARLAALGARDFLVAIGGELLARGRPAPAPAWRVGLEQPLLEARRLRGVVSLSDAAISTSGSYHDFQLRGARRDSHVIDPRSGEPVRHELLAVSVIAPTALRADALATGLLVLGPEAGRALAERERLAVLFLRAEADGLHEHATPEFERFRAATHAAR